MPPPAKPTTNNTTTSTTAHGESVPVDVLQRTTRYRFTLFALHLMDLVLLVRLGTQRAHDHQIFMFRHNKNQPAPTIKMMQNSSRLMANIVVGLGGGCCPLGLHKSALECTRQRHFLAHSQRPRTLSASCGTSFCCSRCRALDNLETFWDFFTRACTWFVVECMCQSHLTAHFQRHRTLSASCGTSFCCLSCGALDDVETFRDFSHHKITRARAGLLVAPFLSGDIVALQHNQSRGGHWRGRAWSEPVQS